VIEKYLDSDTFKNVDDLSLGVTPLRQAIALGQGIFLLSSLPSLILTSSSAPYRPATHLDSSIHTKRPGSADNFTPSLPPRLSEFSDPAKFVE
jgi:hypothetical protein